MKEELFETENESQRERKNPHKPTNKNENQPKKGRKSMSKPSF